MSPKFSQKVEQQLGELTTSTGRTIHFLVKSMDLDLIQRPLDQVQGPWIQWTENSRFSFQSRKVPAASVFEQN